MSPYNTSDRGTLWGPVASTHNLGSQTMTDAALNTVVLKKTESVVSERMVDSRLHAHTDDASSNHVSTLAGSQMNYLLRRKHKLSPRHVKSRTNTEAYSKLASSYSATENIGHIDTIQDKRFNRRVVLKHEDDQLDSDEDSDENTPVNNIADESMHHLRGVRSRDYSQSTSRSNPQRFGKHTPQLSGLTSSGIPSNAAIQESLRRQHQRSGLTRKDYSKRTRVSVLDSSLSSLNKNSALGKYPQADMRKWDRSDQLKSISSGSSIQHQYQKQKYHAQTNPWFQVNKFMEVKGRVTQKNLMKQQFLEFSPCFSKVSQ